jgi:diaminopimelate decarboxylase
VVDVKSAGSLADDRGPMSDRFFVVLDAVMTELIRPMLYNAFHRIEPVVTRDTAAVSVDVVGPLCESSDTLGKNRTLPKPDVGDFYAVLDAGAYGSVMASNYNRRLFPAEVLVENGTWRVIRRRQTLDDLLALES